MGTHLPGAEDRGTGSPAPRTSDARPYLDEIASIMTSDARPAVKTARVCLTLSAAEDAGALSADSEPTPPEQMDTSTIKRRIARNGFVFTDVETDDGTVRVTANGPKTPADPANDGERDTVVRATAGGGETLHESRHPTQGAAASKYAALVEEYSSQ